MLQACDEIKVGIARWLFTHGLEDYSAKLVGFGYFDDEEFIGDMSIVETWLQQIQECVYGMDDYDTIGLAKIAKAMSEGMGGAHIFGDAVTAEDLIALIEPNLEQEYSYDDDEEPAPYYLELSDYDLLEFLKQAKAKQVTRDANFKNMAHSFVVSIMEVINGVDVLPMDKLILAFDHLKDLNHYNGNLLQDYSDLKWNEINDRIEDAVHAEVR